MIVLTFMSFERSKQLRFDWLFEKQFPPL